MTFTDDEIDHITEAFFAGHGRNEAWERYQASALSLPVWFDATLDPFSDAYRQQQLRLWQIVAGRDREYDSGLDEQTVETSSDILRFPGYYRWRHREAIKDAGEHIRAMGNIMAHSGLCPDQRALEYGAGWGLIALGLARLGIHVDTVDISPEFCSYVREQAAFYRVNLRSFEAEFGSVPDVNIKYDLIYFFESFHHCLDSQGLLDRIREALAPNGRVILAGEPIHSVESPPIPYPWGMRLDAATVAVVRRRGWLELGFTEQFIMALFTRHGFVGRRMDGFSAYDRGYVFERRPASIKMSDVWLPDAMELGWHSRDAEGRWTKGDAAILVDTSPTFHSIAIELTNHHRTEQTVRLRHGNALSEASLNPGATAEIAVSALSRAPQILIETSGRVPAEDGISNDNRCLGAYVRRIIYR
jgi:2-polyprenyl-3-methyl-5-hydroxy-6-metoxy-1,4-benzoquinol methylase